MTIRTDWTGYRLVTRGEKAALYAPSGDIEMEADRENVYEEIIDLLNFSASYETDFSPKIRRFPPTFAELEKAEADYAKHLDRIAALEAELKELRNAQ